MSISVAVLVVLSVMRLTRLTVTDSITEPLLVAAINRLHRLPTFQAWFSDLVACSWCTSMWWGFLVAPVGYYWGHTGWFVIGAVVLVSSQFTGLLAQQFDSGERSFTRD